MSAKERLRKEREGNLAAIVDTEPRSTERLDLWHKDKSRAARAKANSDAWAEKKRKALEEFRAKKAAEKEAKKVD